MAKEDKKETKAAPKKAAKKSKDASLNIENVRGNTTDELQGQLLDLKKEQFNLRFQKKNGELTNLARIRQVRRNIAKIQTVQTENRKKEATNA